MAAEVQRLYGDCMRHSILLASCLVCVSPLMAQQPLLPEPATLPDPATLQPGTDANAHPADEKPENKRIFGIIPNYRTYPTLAEEKPISANEKFKIAIEDAFDRGSFIMAAAFAGEGQLNKDNPSFGQGVAGYARYLGTAYADIAIGDFMTEAIYPALLHQDPRYFRRGTGSGPSRAWYAVRQLFWTRMDSGKYQFNYSEVGGNATAAAIANLYYPDNRTAGAAASKLAMQLGIDAVGNLMKEFWPDLEKKFSHKSKAEKR